MSRCEAIAWKAYDCDMKAVFPVRHAIVLSVIFTALEQGLHCRRLIESRRILFPVEIVEVLVPDVGLRWYFDCARLVVGARSITDGDFSEPLSREKLFEISRVLATREELTVFVLQGDFQPCFFHVVVIVFWLEKIKSFVHVPAFLTLRTTSSFFPELANLIGIAVQSPWNVV